VYALLYPSWRSFGNISDPSGPAGAAVVTGRVWHRFLLTWPSMTWLFIGRAVAGVFGVIRRGGRNTAT
jgi:hypothetical protein